jgi:hypothetical protein
VVTRSASSRPNVGTNLKACAAPIPTTTRSWPGTGASTKSRSGVSVYWQRTDRTGGPTSGSIERTWSASSDSIAGSGSLVRSSGSTTGPPQSWAALTVVSPYGGKP